MLINCFKTISNFGTLHELYSPVKDHIKFLKTLFTRKKSNQSNCRGVLTFMLDPFSLKGGLVSEIKPFMTFSVERFSTGELVAVNLPENRK